MPIPQDILDKIMGTTATSAIKPRRGEEIFLGTDYPQDWDAFIGQEAAKEELRVAALSAKARGVRLDHTMLASGLHGIGKTTLATLVAAEAGVGLLQTTGPLTVEQGRELLLACDDRDVLFIDEIHAFGRRGGDWLLPYMTEGKLYGPRGAEDMPDVTIIGATTDAGVLPETLLSRFLLTPELTAYSDTEGALISANLAGRMDIALDLDQHHAAIARAADNNPRAMRKVLSKVRDLAYAYPATAPNLDKAFRFAGVSPDGLTIIAREILVLLLVSQDHTMSQDSIRAQLGEPGPLVHHEKQLQQRGLMQVGSRGRRLTDAGVIRAGEAIEELAP